MATKSSFDLLNNLKFCVIDLETTGGNPQNDKIIEVGMVIIEELKITKEKNYFINPQKPIPEFIQKLTSIKTEDVKDAPVIEDVIDDIVEFIDDAILVAHNTSFDIPFLNAVLKLNQRKELKNKIICTNIMTKYMIPEIVNSNLNFMAQIFNLEHSKAHRAIEDAKATAELLLTYLNIFKNKGIKKVNQLYYPRNRFELDRLHFERDNFEDVIQILQKESRPLTLTIKGESGVIQSIIPLSCPEKEVQDFSNFLKDLSWQSITIKLCGPFFHGLMELNQNFLKMPQENRDRVISFISRKLVPQNDDEKNVSHDFDFLILPHLVQGQLLVYSLNNLSLNTHLVFKFPAHKKKLSQFISGQISRSTKKRKGTKEILPELRPLFHSHLNGLFKGNSSFFLKKELFLEDPKLFFKPIDTFIKNNKDFFSFPKNYLQ